MLKNNALPRRIGNGLFIPDYYKRCASQIPISNVSDNNIKLQRKFTEDESNLKRISKKIPKRLDLILTFLYNEFNKAADIVTKITM